LTLIRCGWGLGAETLRQELPESVRGGAGEHQRADVRQATVAEKSRRILREELGALGWDGATLAQWLKGDAVTYQIGWHGSHLGRR
jgi:hypothetical protein